MEIGGSELVAAPPEVLWRNLNDPAVLTRCIPGCKSMTEVAPDSYKVDMQLRVAAVGGSFEGKVALHDKDEPKTCRLTVSGGGTLGHGNGEARFTIEPQPDGGCKLSYEGAGEIGGLVAGVGQRVLGSVSKHLIGKFFAAFRKEIAAAAAPGQESMT
jgi:carbon monoxide dehydrogenase subunit G